MQENIRKFTDCNFKINDLTIVLDIGLSEKRYSIEMRVEKLLNINGPYIGIMEVKRFMKIPNTIPMMFNGKLTENKDFLDHYIGMDKETWSITIFRGVI